jgi:hypothetical protein
MNNIAQIFSAIASIVASITSIVPTAPTEPPPPTLSEPSWYSNKNFEYPDSQYISAIGKGDSYEEAKTMAVSDLSLYFKTSASVRNESIYQYNQVFSNKNTQSNRSFNSKETALITSQEVFLGVRFTSPYYNEKTSTWAVLGYIIKQEALQMYQARINANSTLVDALIAAGNQESEVLYKCGYFHQAASVSRIIEEDIKDLSSVASDSMQYADISAKVQKAVAEYNTLRSQAVFDVQISNDRQNIIQRKIVEILEKNGYIVSPKNAVYVITGEVTIEKTESSSLFFVRPSITLGSQNSEGSILRFSYTVNIQRFGAKSQEQAFNQAFADIAKDLGANFMMKFNADIGG